MMADHAPFKFGFYLVPGFSLLALSGAVDALRAANSEIEHHEFEWVMIGETHSGARSSSGIVLPCEYYANAPRLDAIAIVGGDASHDYANPPAIQWFREQARHGIAIGSISDGAFVAAQANLFDQVPSTIHWKCVNAYRERFPDLDVRPTILEMHEKRFSCAGGTAGLDLMLKFIALRLGSEVAANVAENYFHDTIRDENLEQLPLQSYRLSLLDRRLARAVTLMQEALEYPLEISQLAAQLAMSHRQLDRVFKRHLNCSPSAHYRDLRLTRAFALLRQSDLSIAEITSACGFNSASHFTKFFKAKYQITPGKLRQTGGTVGRLDETPHPQTI